jgi:hypothetical protein
MLKHSWRLSVCDRHLEAKASLDDRRPSRSVSGIPSQLQAQTDAMTMSYPVDKPEVLKKIKVGDTIMATVYKGETTLHDVMVVPPGKQDKKSAK